MDHPIKCGDGCGKTVGSVKVGADEVRTADPETGKVSIRNVLYPDYRGDEHYGMLCDGCALERAKAIAEREAFLEEATRKYIAGEPLTSEERQALLNK